MTKNYQNPDLCILIPAAGIGERIGLGPKALLTLNGKPLLYWVTRKALQLSDQVVVTAPPGHVEAFAQLCPDCQIIEGGETRQASVEKLVAHSTRPYIIIHDVARPFVSLDLFLRVYHSAQTSGCAGTFLTPDIPVAVIENGIVTRGYKRSQVGIFQGPQAFARPLLEECITKAREFDWNEQSTLQLALRAGIAVAAVEGEKNNIKLTTPEDWALAPYLAGHLD